MRIESLILNVLLNDTAFLEKTIHYIRPEYFSSKHERVIYELISEYHSKYDKAPTKDVLSLKLEELVGLSESEIKETRASMKEALEDKYEYDLQWAVDSTEKFCQEKAVYNAIMKSVKIINKEEPKLSLGAIPLMLQEALGVSFDHRLGHSYFDDAQERFKFYNQDEVRIKCSIDLINKITGNGMPRKTLCLFISPSGGGKSAVMCSLAADYLRDGLNVLYLTMELAEERVAERIDANLFNIPIQDVKGLPEKVFLDRVQSLHSKTQGKLFIKEYPTGVGSAGQFKVLINDLIAKKGFRPDVLIVDYLGICTSDKYRNSSSANSYTVQKAVAEEMRALAMEFDMLCVSAVQTNRSAYNSSDFDMDAISESAGIAMTADLLLGIIRTEELDELGQMMIKQLKSRFGDPNYFKRFVVGLDRSRMKMYNIESQQQTRDGNVDTSKEEPEESFRQSKYKSKVDSMDFDFN